MGGGANLENSRGTSFSKLCESSIALIDYCGAIHRSTDGAPKKANHLLVLTIEDGQSKKGLEYGPQCFEVTSCKIPCTYYRKQQTLVVALQDPIRAK